MGDRLRIDVPALPSRQHLPASRSGRLVPITILPDPSVMSEPRTTDPKVPAGGLHAEDGPGPDPATDAARSPSPSSPISALRFPVEPAKILPPPLRDDTLSRERLLDWLDAKIHHRIVLLTAEAGYGKTTLLADFSRHTRLRVAWVRLDREERDPVAFLNYLVASGRRIEPGFAPTTGSLLSEMATGPTDHETLVRTFVQELKRLGAEPTVLVLDDVHLVDDADDVRSILRAIVAASPDRLTLVMVSRRRPRVPLARLRTLGEVVELEADDLRFLPEETERLFRDAYHQPLEPDVLSTLSTRTEGWAASLQLAHTALRGRTRPEIRSFVNSLSGSMSELHDYLAEEVVADLDPQVQRFLMRAAVLQVVRPTLAAIAGEVDEAEAERDIQIGEAAGLLGRRGDPGQRTHRYHPLVQDFLLERYRRDAGDEAIRVVHRRVATWAETRDWRLAAHHFAAAGDVADLRRVLAASIGQVMASGEFAYAESLVEGLPQTGPDAALEIFLSRLDFYRNRPEDAVRRAAAATSLLTGEQREVALANQAALEIMAGHVADALAHAKELQGSAETQSLRDIALGLMSLVSSSDDGNLRVHSGLMATMVESQLARGERYYAAVSSLNLACSEMHRSCAPEAIRAATQALDLLLDDSGPESCAALESRAWARIHSGDIEGGNADLAACISTSHDLTRAEMLIEAAGIDAGYGDIATAEERLAASRSVARSSPNLAAAWAVAAAECRVRRRDPEGARQTLAEVRLLRPWFWTGLHVRLKAVRARASLTTGSPGAIGELDEAEAHAMEQDATYWINYCRLLRHLIAGPDEMNDGLHRVLVEDRAMASLLAEEVGDRLGDLDAASLDLVAAEVALRPKRWRPVLRSVVERGERRAAVPAGRLLKTIGEASDIRRLRKLARANRLAGADGQLGQALARQLAERVEVQDLGRMLIRIGDQEIAGADIRRKVLAMLTFLGSRPSFSATRDQVVEALWPEQAPKDALNSLNQTLYFLRRIFEPDYDEDVSAGYVNYSGDLLWLDPQLLSTTSRRCQGLLERLRRSIDWDDVETLSRTYTAPFALDFAYEEWAEGFRAALHNAYLETIERAVHDLIDEGRFDRALTLARRAVEVEPTAENLHVLVIGVCRQLGAHAAAAEQYATYAAYLKDELGVDPPALESIRPGVDR